MKCSVDGCERKKWAKGMCLMHYKRVWRGNDIGEGSPTKHVVMTGTEDSFLAHLRQEGECLVSTFKSYNRYGHRKIKVQGVWVTLHRYAWERVNGPIPGRLIVRHLCNNPACCRIEHLALGTHADNSKDMLDAGRQSRGEGRHSAKLTEDDVRSIRTLITIEGFTSSRLAKLYGLSVSAMCRVVKGQTWKHIH